MDFSTGNVGATNSVVRILLVLAALAFCSGIQAQTSVWKAEKEGSYIYLGGTVHILTADDYPLPEAYDRAYADSDTVYFETDIGEANSPAFATRIAAAMSYSDGRTLQTVLDPEVYAQLSDYFSGKGVPILLMNGFTPGGVSLTISILELQSLGYTSAGVDMHFYTKASNDGRKLGFFESVDEQLTFIAALGEGIENDIIRYTLADIARLGGLLDTLKAQWRTGDIEGLDSTMIAELRDQFPDVYTSLISDRNNNWMPDIEAMFQTDEVEFVLVGAGHMGGPDGLLQQLASKGYTITQIQ